MRQGNAERGFTLIELMVVVAIIGILAAIAIPAFASYRTNTFNASAVSDMRNLATAEEAYYVDQQVYLDLAAITGVLAAIPNLPGARISKNVCIEVTNASAVDFTLKSENFEGNKSYTTSQSGNVVVID
ncbi:MAG: prepilin-type N-terminal cleavage/methylation domain-containing protein, partial [Mariprofundaceae bacterium]|nr:prepilin-type N-terminal cleavage/methylation domain-containing protein [Mariprofundaceae bacterium]